MTPLRYFLLTSLATLGTHALSSVLDLIPNSFDQIVVESGKPAMVKFFAPWCGHCKNLAPIWEELAEKFAFAEDKVSIAKVDADEHKGLGRRFGVQGFPTLKWFDGKSDTPTDYTGGRDLDSLSAFIVEKTGIKMKKMKPSAVEVLTDRTFKGRIGGDINVFVAFTASWCGHCKTLAPIWEALANDFAAESTVLIAKVDATAENAKSTAEDQGVKSYPSIKYYPKGTNTPEIYEGERTEQEFIRFLNNKTGTHRVAGGRLDATAGTITSLDIIVSKFTAGRSLATVLDEANKAAKELQDKYAVYYLKVLGNLSKNEGYVEKELARLEGLIKKGGLASEKLDDLISRSNVLRRFSKKSVKEEL